MNKHSCRNGGIRRPLRPATTGTIPTTERFNGFDEPRREEAVKARTARIVACGGVLLGSNQYVAYATLALGSALAAFMYPHTLTGIFASPKCAYDPQDRDAFAALYVDVGIACSSPLRGVLRLTQA